jgi:hypothetical protein
MAKKKTTTAAKKKTSTTAAKKTTSTQRSNRGNDATSKETTTGSGATTETTTKRSPAAKPRSQVEMKITHDQIAQRAYEIWLAKGRPPGQEEQNWHQAEAELRREKSR